MVQRIGKESLKMPAGLAGSAGKMLLAACMTALLLSSGGFRNTAVAAETETEILPPVSGTGDQDAEGKTGSWSVPAEKIEEARALDTSHVADASDMTTVEELEESGNTVSADMLEDGVYEIVLELKSETEATITMNKVEG